MTTKHKPSQDDQPESQSKDVKDSAITDDLQKKSAGKVNYTDSDKVAKNINSSEVKLKTSSTADDKGSENTERNAKTAHLVDKTINEIARHESLTGNRKKTADKANSDNKVPSAHLSEVASSSNSPESASSPKKVGLVVLAALLLGVIGTGLGLYSISKSNDIVQALRDVQSDKQVLEIQEKLQHLGTKDIQGLSAALDKVSAFIQSVDASVQKTASRLDEIEAQQQSIARHTQADIAQVVGKHMKALNTLADKVNAIDLSQQRLIQKLGASSSAMAPAPEAAHDFSQAQVAYLLNMANYKLKYEQDSSSAIDLLQMVEDKLGAGDSDNYRLLRAEIAKTILRLQDVKAIDGEVIVAQLQQLSEELPTLKVRTADVHNEKAKAHSDADKLASNGFLNKIGTIVASGVKYTPKDASQLNITAETAEIAERLLAVDLQMAQLAVLTKHQALFVHSLHAAKSRLQMYFAEDDTSKNLIETLSQLGKIELQTALPDVSGLLKIWQQSQSSGGQ